LIHIHISGVGVRKVLRALSRRCLPPFAAVFLAACDVPKDTAVVRQNLGAGAVYKGTLLHVDTLYVDSFRQGAYSQTASAAAQLAIARATAGNSLSSQKINLATNLAAAATSQIESRVRGHACQYFIEVDNEDLLDTISISNSNRYADQIKADRLRQEYDAAIRELSQLKAVFLNIQNQLAQVSLKQSQGEVKLDEEQETVIEGQLTEQRENLRQIIEQRERILIDRKIQYENRLIEGEQKPKTIAVSNPCREFEVGDTILIIDYGFEYVLERIF